MKCEDHRRDDKKGYIPGHIHNSLSFAYPTTSHTLEALPQNCGPSLVRWLADDKIGTKVGARTIHPGIVPYSVRRGRVTKRFSPP